MTLHPSAATAQKLLEAKRNGELVRIETCFGPGWVTGYVLEVGPGFVMLAIVNDRIWFDGFECFRLPDVVSVEADRRALFVETALDRRGEKRPAKPDVSLLDIESLVRSAGAAFPLVTLHTEVEDPDVCWIGRMLRVAEGEVSLLEITPSAEWDEEPTNYRLSDVTRVSFGADYEDALFLVAGEPDRPA